MVLTASPLIKAVTNVLPLTKTLDSFEVEEHDPNTLQSKCPNVSVIQDFVARLDAEKQVSTYHGLEIFEWLYTAYHLRPFMLSQLLIQIVVETCFTRCGKIST